MLEIELQKQIMKLKDDHILLQKSVLDISTRTVDTVKLLQTASNIIERQDEELKHLKGRVDRNAENIVKIQKPGG